MTKAYHKCIFSYTIKTIVMLLTFTLVSACNQTRPITENQAEFQISQESVILGKDALKHFEKIISYARNNALQHYVQTVGQRILQATPARNTPFTFKVIVSAYPQAYALPDGHIFVTTGLLALFNNESQLAALLAHEIAHVIAGHTLERFKKRKQLASLMLRLNKALDNRNSREMTALFGKVSIRRYNRKNEYHADSLSVTYLQQSPYSKHASIDVLELIQLSISKASRKTGNRKRIFSTHPAIEKRIKALKERFQHKRIPPEKAYLMRINNLVLDRKKKKKLQIKLYTFTSKNALSQTLREIKQQNNLLYQLILVINDAHTESQLKKNRLLKWLIVTEDKPEN